MTTHAQITKDAIHAELESTRKIFHTLLDSPSENDWKKKSLNPGWTNGEILVHMAFGFIVLNALLPMTRLWGRFPKWTSKPFAWSLNALTVPFNWINALGARLQARVFTFRRIGQIYDWIHYSLVKQIDSIEDVEWNRGMYYPTRWDPNFGEFMTLEKLFQYPVLHFHFHLQQIAR